jgi:antitoxin component YwqK of YwqJK toxin-antitoxin module
MRKLLILSAFFLFSIFTYSQESEKLKKIESNIVEVYEDGSTKQEGNYKNNKPDGKWVSYNRDGSISMIGFYDDGLKNGTFIFRTENSIKEVLYINNELIEVKLWDEYRIVSNLK